MENYIQDLDKEAMKDIQVLSECIIELAQQLARSASICSDATFLSNTAKKQAYFNYVSSIESQQKYHLSPMLIKDFISSKYAEEAACEIYAERINRALTHTLEGLRSVLSAAKTEFQTLAYARS